MLRTSLVVSTLLAVAGAGSLTADIPRHGRPDARRTTPGVSYTPGIRIWTSGSDLHRRGDRVRLFYRTERDAFVMIFRVDTDGRVELLFPRTPDEENYGSAGATYSVAAADPNSAFYVDDDPGVGYLFGVASLDPFDYREILSYDGRWDLTSISDGMIHGDPRSSMEELVQNLLPSEYQDFDTHLLPYYVGDRRQDYPRFVCYDCHVRMPYAVWNPYGGWCGSYTLTVYNDPYYYYPSYWYPTWYYGGTRVVYRQPQGSRYVFKDRGSASAPGVDYRDRRYTPGTSGGTASRRPESRGIRGSDIGGTGSVPAPRTPMRREAPPLAGGEQPREPRAGGVDPQRPAGGDSPARRESSSGQPSSQPKAAAPDAGGRRRVDAQPGIQIVPRSGVQPASPTPSSSGRRSEPGSYGNEPRPARPVARGSASPSRAELTVAAPERRQEVRSEPRPDVNANPREPRPAAPPPRESRPEAAPEARQPAPRPEARPQSQPQASPPRESPPKSDPGLVRRRP